MTGLFGTFNIAKNNTSQATIDVTSHNISNSNTVWILETKSWNWLQRDL